MKEWANGGVQQRRTHLPTDCSHAMDHIVVVLFENRSLDNVLGHLYGPRMARPLRV